MHRNVELERRIKERKANDKMYHRNSYGGMGMDGISEEERKLRLEELDYIRNHPEIYKTNVQTNDASMYLIKLN